MALGETKRFRMRTFAIALAIMAGFSAINGPTSAQVYWGDRPSGDHRSRGGLGRPPFGRLGLGRSLPFGPSTRFFFAVLWW